MARILTLTNSKGLFVLASIIRPLTLPVWAKADRANNVKKIAKTASFTLLIYTLYTIEHSVEEWMGFGPKSNLRTIKTNLSWKSLFAKQSL